MKKTSNASADQLAGALHSFFGQYLPAQRNASAKTIASYRDGIKQLLIFAAARGKTPVTALGLERLDAECVLAFLEHLEKERGVGVHTRNQRLAALRSFFRHAAALAPEHLQQCRRILNVPFKRTGQKAPTYLEREEMAALLGQPDRARMLGQRDHLIVSLMYNTGCRVQELVQLRPRDLSLEPPYGVRLLGKGDKERLCPLWPQTIQLARDWLARRKLPARSDEPLFLNQRGQPLTRFGVRTLLKKYRDKARAVAPSLEFKAMHPHVLRHTTAVHLLQADVDLNMIRDILGHVSITTTNRYAEIDMAMKRKALDPLGKQTEASTAGPSWSRDPTILEWLESL